MYVWYDGISYTPGYIVPASFKRSYTCRYMRIAVHRNFSSYEYAFTEMAAKKRQYHFQQATGVGLKKMLTQQAIMYYNKIPV